MRRAGNIIRGSGPLIREGMMTTVWGTVRDGVIVPDAPLPEGQRVEIRLPELPPELRAELEDWDRASAGALDLVERLAAEGGPDEPR